MTLEERIRDHKNVIAIYEQDIRKWNGWAMDARKVIEKHRGILARLEKEKADADSGNES